MSRLPLLPLALFVLLTSAAAVAQDAGCRQFFPGGQPPALTNPKLGQRTTLLCNDGYASLASGVTHGVIWSAEHPTAAQPRWSRYGTSGAKASSTPRTGCRRPTRRSSPTTAAAATTAAT